MLTHARDGPGRDDVDADARRRGARRRLERRSRPSGRRPIAKYGNPNFGGQQLTAGSNSVRGMWKMLREVGRHRARDARSPPPRRRGASPRTRCTTEKGEVVHQASGRRLKYGALVDKAAALPVPKNVTLKDPKDFKLLGQVAAAARHPREGERHGRVRHRREAPGHAHRARRALPGVRRQGRQLQRRQGEGRSRRAARRPDQHRHRRRRRQLLGRDARARRRSTSSGTKARSRR